MSSTTPPKEPELEHGTQSGEDQEQHMDRNHQQAQPQQGQTEFEVKEQDRWLPIANGSSAYLCVVALAEFPYFFPPPSGQNAARLQ